MSPEGEKIQIKTKPDQYIKSEILNPILKSNEDTWYSLHADMTRTESCS